MHHILRSALIQFAALSGSPVHKGTASLPAPPFSRLPENQLAKAARRQVNFCAMVSGILYRVVCFCLCRFRRDLNLQERFCRNIKRWSLWSSHSPSTLLTFQHTQQTGRLYNTKPMIQYLNIAQQSHVKASKPSGNYQHHLPHHLPTSTRLPKLALKGD